MAKISQDSRFCVLHEICVSCPNSAKSMGLIDPFFSSPIYIMKRKCAYHLGIYICI